MSMSADIAELFRIWHKENKWSEEKTIGYFLSIYSALEWDLLEEEPIDENGEFDFAKEEELEIEEAKKLLFR